jgi:hypothetical protein
LSPATHLIATPKEHTSMEPETDRVMADELRGILKKLRDENKELKDEKESGSISTLVWVIVALVVVLAFALFSGGDGHHYHRY